MGPEKPHLFQFWDSPAPPSEVTELLATWQSEPDFTYQRFNAAEAEAFIADHLGARATAAYRRCAIPAMQADFFRYAALYIKGGVYVDAGTSNRGGLGAMIAKARRGILVTKGDIIMSAFLFVRSPQDPLYGRMIDQAIVNIENQISNNSWVVTGPRIPTAMHRAPETNHLFDNIDFITRKALGNVVQIHADLAYKSESTDWRYHRDLPEGSRTIFRPD